LIRRWIFVVLISVWCAPWTAIAQPISLQRFQPHGDGTGWFATESAETLPPLLPVVSLWFNEANDPIGFAETEGEREVHGDLLSIDIQTALGLGDVDLSFTLPVHMAHPWNNHTRIVGIGDLRFTVKAHLFDPTQKGIGLGAVVPVSIPTGHAEHGFGMPGATISPSLLLSGYLRFMRVGLQLGIRAADTGIPAAEGARNETYVSGLLRASAGVHFGSPVEGILELGGEMYGDVGANPMELLVGLRARPNDAFAIHVAGSFRIKNRSITTPDARFVLGVSFLPPSPLDLDRNRQITRRDEGPRPGWGLDKHKRRDRRSWEGDPLEIIEELSSPEPVAERHVEPEPRADEPVAELTATEIVIHQQVHFETDRSSLLDESLTVLVAVAEILGAHPEVLLVEIQGHADERGSEHYNLTLSQARADAVLQTLVALGVAPDRLFARGYGTTAPLVEGDDERAYASNRRVQFIILGIDSD